MTEHGLRGHIPETDRTLILHQATALDRCWGCQQDRAVGELFAVEMLDTDGESLMRGPICATCVAGALAIRVAAQHVREGGSVSDLLPTQ